MRLFQCFGDLRGGHSFQRHSVDHPDGHGRHRVDDPLPGIVGVGTVAVHGLRGIAQTVFLTEAPADGGTAGQIPGVPVVHEIVEGSHDGICFPGHIYVVHQGNKSHVVLREYFFHIMSGLQVVAPQSGQIPDDDGLDVPLPDLLQHLLKAGTVEVSAGISVVGKVAEPGIAVVGSIGLQHFLLMGDAGGFPVGIVLHGQTFIQCGIGDHGASSF